MFFMMIWGEECMRKFVRNLMWFFFLRFCGSWWSFLVLILDIMVWVLKELW